MKINNIKSPSFTSGNQIINHAQTQIAEFSTKPRAITAFDKFLFRMYTFSQTLKPNFKKEDIKKLFELDTEDFIFESYEYLTNYLDIPYKLRPSIKITNLGNDVNMAYDYINNSIEVNESCLHNPKIEIFASIRHELQHLLQNIAIFRYDKTAKQAVESYSDISVQTNMEIMKDIMNNYSSAQIIESDKKDSTNKLFAAIKFLIEENRTEEFNEAIEIVKKVIKDANTERLKHFRKNVIKEYGSLKNDSKQANRAEKYFKDFKNRTYYKNDGTIHSGEYKYSITENEALLAEDVTKNAVSGELDGCFIRNYRLESVKTGQYAEKIEKKEKDIDINQDEIQEITELMETQKKLAQKYKNENDFIKYLSDYLYD